jgi:hypothetical protein
VKPARPGRAAGRDAPAAGRCRRRAPGDGFRPTRWTRAAWPACPSTPRSSKSHQDHLDYQHPRAVPRSQAFAGDLLPCRRRGHQQRRRPPWGELAEAAARSPSEPLLPSDVRFSDVRSIRRRQLR